MSLEARLDRTRRDVDAPPRKVVIGTCRHPMWGAYPGLDARIAELGALVDRMAEQAKTAYDGAGLDLAILPEAAASASLKSPVSSVAWPLDGAVLEGFGAIARRHRCYLIVPLFLAETERSGGRAGTFSNVAVLLDRAGSPVGIYRKLHPVMGAQADVLEGGVTPGTAAEVFACDFGRVGIQICFDIGFDDGWDALAAGGAEIVAWPTQSPGQRKAAVRAMRGGYFVASSTWRNNASIFDPTGEMIATIGDDADVLVTRVDLEYRLLPWQPALQNGQAFDAAFGPRAGYRYSEAEDGGIFWSNDPSLPIGRMVEQLNLETEAAVLLRSCRLQNELRPR